MVIYLHAKVDFVALDLRDSKGHTGSLTALSQDAALCGSNNRFKWSVADNGLNSASR